MSIIHAAIVPHPPVMVPEVGGAERLKPIEKTVSGMLRLSQEISALNPEVFVIITPHGPVYPDGISIRIPSEKRLSGNLWQFGASDTGVEFESDNEFAYSIVNESSEAGIRLIELEDDSLDHGVIAPMYYILKALHTPAKMVSMNISFEGYRKHFDFGRVLYDVCEKDPRRIVFIASGDLSHRLTKDAPAGYNKEGEKFDKQLMEFLEQGNRDGILLMDPFWVDEAGECGLRSICTLLGVISEGDFEQKKYSYEGPYGVGYLVMGYAKKR